MAFFHGRTQPFDPQSDDDVRLMRAFQAGEKLAFEELMRRYYPRLLNFIYRYVHSAQRAEDLTQEVLIKVYQNAHRYTPQSKFKTWLYTIAKHVSLNALRKRTVVITSLDQDIQLRDGTVRSQVSDEGSISPADAVVRQETAQAVQRAIQALPENQRTAVILRRYEGFSYEEIAETMGLSLAAVKSLLSRAKEALKISLAHLADKAR